LVDARETFAGDPHIEVKSSSPGWTHLLIIPAVGLVEKVGGFVRAVLADLPPPLCEELSLAVDELLTNSMEHGCRLDARCPLAFKFIRTPRMVLFQIEDAGAGFSVDSVIHAAFNNPPEDPLRHAHLRNQLGMRPGGFGIMLIKKIADELLYNERGNEVILLKYLDQL
jgi:anti-sigma regulatory factor (Ser/Thr protein kinase)